MNIYILSLPPYILPQMLILLGILLSLSATGTKAKSAAQVLVTSRGEPAPFAHFPAIAAVPAVPPEEPAPAFEFAPTPNGLPLAPAPIEPEPLPVVHQSIGEMIFLKKVLAKL